MKQLPKGATIKPHIVMPLFHLAVADLNGEEHSAVEKNSERFFEV